MIVQIIKLLINVQVISIIDDRCYRENVDSIYYVTLGREIIGTVRQFYLDYASRGNAGQYTRCDVIITYY